MKKLILVSLLFFAAFSFAKAQYTWVNVAPSHLNYNFYGITIQDDSTIWAVTFVPAVIYRSNDYGNSWVTSLYDPNALFKAVHFFNDSVGIAGGNDTQTGKPVILRTTNKGASWTRINPPSSISLQGINGFHEYGPDSCIAYGNRGYMLSTYDGGATWGGLQISTNPSWSPNVWDVYLRNTTLYTATSSGLLEGAGLGLTNLNNSNTEAVEFKLGHGYFAIGDTNFFYSMGFGWSTSYVPASTTQVNSMAVTDSGRVFVATEDQKIYTSTDYGLSWTLESTPNTASRLFDIICFKDDVWAVGTNGRILKRVLVTSLEDKQKEPKANIVYPNPVEDRLNINGDFDRLDIYNLNGQIVRNYSVYQSSIDLSDLDPAIYLLRIHNGDTFSDHKVVKQ